MTSLQELYDEGKLQVTFGRDGKLVAFDHWNCETCDGTGIVEGEDCEECGGIGEVSQCIPEDDPRWSDIQQLAEELNLAPDGDDGEE